MFIFKLEDTNRNVCIMWNLLETILSSVLASFGDGSDFNPLKLAVF